MSAILSRGNNKFFITGTDTGVGKTYISTSLIKSFNALGYSTIGIKPVSSGCKLQGNSLVNEDALSLQQVSSIYLDYPQVNPFAFERPIAPNIAALQTATDLSVKNIIQKTQFALTTCADVHIIEGVGGWFVPLNADETMADYVIQSELQVILVVGIRLGCLNHALLTYHAIQNSRAPLVGWIANCFQSEKERETTAIIATLKKWLKIPCLSVVDFQAGVDINNANSG